MRPSSTVRRYQVTGRTPGSGSVVAVFTDGPTDPAVATAAADWATDTRTLLIAAATVTDTGFSINPLLHRARAHRMTADSMAIVGRVTLILTAAGVAWRRTTLTVPAGIDPARTLPLSRVHHLIDRFAAVAVVTVATLHDPTGRLTPSPATRQAPARPTPAPAPAGTADPTATTNRQAGP